MHISYGVRRDAQLIHCNAKPFNYENTMQLLGRSTSINVAFLAQFNVTISFVTGMSLEMSNAKHKKEQET